MGICKY